MVQIPSIVAGNDYTVQAGDSLWTIAERAYGSGVEWAKIFHANIQIIGQHPDLIHPDQVLHIPPLATSAPPQPLLPLRISTEIQGDILAGFNKDYRLYLFLQFPDQPGARAWLKDLIPFIANTKDVAAFNSLFSLARRAGAKTDPGNLTATWVNVSFTIDGLKELLNADPTASLNARGFKSFTTGPEAQATANGDTGLSAPENWVVGLQKQQIHALLNIQADNLADLKAEVQKLKALASQYKLTVVYEQSGATLPGDLRGHEHFGYKDGISQPGVKDFDEADLSATDVDSTAILGYVQSHPGTEIIQPGEFILGQQPEQGQVFDSTALTWMVNGSFLVFRRLNQDVPGYNEQEQRNLDPLPPEDPLRSKIGAMLMGRWKSGTPLDLSPDTDNGLTSDAEINNFNFLARDVENIHVDDDEKGLRCPHFSHIRKLHPRQHNFPPSTNRIRRIIRRGIPFGNPYDPERGDGFDAKAERGLVFVAYMSSIEDKFEFLMRTWVNIPGFPVPAAPNQPGIEDFTGPDPVIGDSARPSPLTLAHPDGNNVQADFLRKVQTTGTLYSFVPSISALNDLANGTA